MPDDDSKPIEQPQQPSEIIPEDEFLVDRVFPTKRIHLIAGPVGAGKTTFDYQLSRAILDGADFLGNPTHCRGRLVYLAADRTRREAIATLRRMGSLDLLKRIKWLFVNEIKVKGIIPLLEVIIDQHCQPGDFLTVEPFQFFLRDEHNRTGDPNSSMDVSHWICRIKGAVEKAEITLLGSVHPPKAKKGEGYGSVRDRLVGTSAWTGYTSTTVYIEPSNPDDVTDPYRTIHILVRDGQNFALEYMQEPEHGLLVPVAAQKPFKSRLDEILEAHEGPFFRQDLERWMEEANISLSTAKRWLKQKVADGYVESTTRGGYQKRMKS